MAKPVFWCHRRTRKPWLQQLPNSLQTPNVAFPRKEWRGTCAEHFLLYRWCRPAGGKTGRGGSGFRSRRRLSAVRIAFYAPMKPASSPVPSGDREMARNLIVALERHHQVDVATEFVSRDGKGDPEIQRNLATQGTDEARALIENWQTETVTKRPEAWFTYHVYHKAPDWVGPAVSEALNIPYFMAEVSHAPKQAGGPWDIGYCAAESAIRNARGIFGLSALDAACVLPLLDDPGRYHKLAPFTDTRPFARAMERSAKHRKEVIDRFGFHPAAPILLAVGMMREGDKLASYGVLAEALSMLSHKAWSLLIVGDGPARGAVESFFHEVPSERIGFAGTTAPDGLPGLYAAADLMVWPAINEAFGMAMLEAQATGLPSSPDGRAAFRMSCTTAKPACCAR